MSASIEDRMKSDQKSSLPERIRMDLPREFDKFPEAQKTLVISALKLEQLITDRTMTSEEESRQESETDPESYIRTEKVLRERRDSFPSATRDGIQYTLIDQKQEISTEQGFNRFGEPRTEESKSFLVESQDNSIAQKYTFLYGGLTLSIDISAKNTKKHLRFALAHPDKSDPEELKLVAEHLEKLLKDLEVSIEARKQQEASVRQQQAQTNVKELREMLEL